MIFLNFLLSERWFCTLSSKHIDASWFDHQILWVLLMVPILNGSKHLSTLISRVVKSKPLLPNYPTRLRAGASTRFTSTSTSTSTCNMCEYEYEYLIITWVRVRVRVLVDEYEYKCEYRSMINILYSMYRQQIFIVRSLTRESSDCYKPGTKLQLPIVHVNYLCQYISV